MKFFKAVFISLFFFAANINPIWAQDEIQIRELLEELRTLKMTVNRQEKRIAELEARLSGKEKGQFQLNPDAIEELDKHIDSHLLHRIPGYQIFDGLRIGLGATSIIQGAHNANGDDLTTQDEDITDVSYSVDLEFEKKFKEFGLAYIHLETGDGAGVEGDLKVLSNVNRDADDSDNSISLTEVWYEHYFNRLPLTLTLGKIDPTVYIDNSEYANDETTQFLGRMFRNSPVIDFPDNSFGLHAGIEPADFLDISFIAIDADSEWEDVFNDLFLGAQLNFKPRFFEKDGNYRLLAWIDNRAHTKWVDTAKTKEQGYGLGMSFDREITDTLGVFARYVWQDPKVYLPESDFSLEHAYSFGLQLKGNLWKRNEDILALAFGQIFPSTDYKSANNLKAESEHHLEVYYSFKVNDHLMLSPDFQVIRDPYGGDAANGDKTIFVGGIRAQVDF